MQALLTASPGEIESLEEQKPRNNGRTQENINPKPYLLYINFEERLMHNTRKKKMTRHSVMLINILQILF